MPRCGNCNDSTLSPRQEQIFTLLGEGLVRKEVAARMEITVSTFDAQMGRIREKLKLPYAYDVAVAAIRANERKAIQSGSVGS